MKSKLAEVFSIISGKGGVGKTFISINLAYALNNFNKKVLLIDSNITTPNVSIVLRVDRRGKTIHDFLKSKIELEDAIFKTKYGFDLIPGSLQIEDLVDVDLDRLYFLYKVREKYDYIILDSSAGLGREAYSSIKAADETILVTTPEKAALMDALRAIKICKTLGTKIKGIILNRYTENVDLYKIETLLEEKLIGTVREDENVQYSMNIGIPLIEIDPNSPASLDILNISKRILGIKEEIKEEGFLTKIFNIFKWR
ncbi:MAG: cell division ATPase MinD [Candidatus Methanomethylicia archaeon]